MATAPLLQVVIALVAGVTLIILFTTKYRLHAFFALLIACFLVGHIVHGTGDIVDGVYCFTNIDVVKGFVMGSN